MLVVALVGACGLESVTDDDDAAEVRFGDRSNAEPGDLERDIGEPGEAYGRSARVDGARRVDAFNDIDAEGYVVLDVTVTNVGDRAEPHHRGDWSLELADGRRVSTAPVEGQPQLRTGEFSPGESVSGALVFAVGDDPGPYFAVFMPREHRNDADDRVRVVWGVALQ